MDKTPWRRSRLVKSDISIKKISRNFAPPMRQSRKGVGQPAI